MHLFHPDICQNPEDNKCVLMTFCNPMWDWPALHRHIFQSTDCKDFDSIHSKKTNVIFSDLFEFKPIYCTFNQMNKKRCQGQGGGCLCTPGNDYESIPGHVLRIKTGFSFRWETLSCFSPLASVISIK